MNVRIIINPVAGGRRRSAPPSVRLDLARRAMDQAGASGDVVLTEGPGHARTLASDALAAGRDLVVAWGGDGTINEVASTLVGSSTAFGIVRAGSGNGAARELGIPLDPALALADALSGHHRAIDTGEIDGRFFLNIAGIGFDATMARLFNELGGETRGTGRYTRLALRHAFGYRAEPYTLTVDGRGEQLKGLLVALANMPQYGSNAVIAPGARPDDGELDLVVVREHGPLGRLGLGLRALTRTMDRARGVRIRRVHRVLVESDRPILFHVDGECFEGGRAVDAHVQPASLRLATRPR